jgi:hypothetical protein
VILQGDRDAKSEAGGSVNAAYYAALYRLLGPTLVRRRVRAAPVRPGAPRSLSLQKARLQLAVEHTSNLWLTAITRSLRR